MMMTASVTQQLVMPGSDHECPAWPGLAGGLRRLSTIPGSSVEHNTFCVSAHYRNCPGDSGGRPSSASIFRSFQ